MRKWIVYGVILLVISWVSPNIGTDIGDLQPVELIQLSRENGKIVLETDTGDVGKGESVQQALDNLKKTTPGEVFLNTADFLLLQNGETQLLPEMYTILRPGTEVCLIRGKTDCPKAAKYLAAHNPGTSLRAFLYEHRQVPTLLYAEGRFELVEGINNG